MRVPDFTGRAAEAWRVPHRDAWPADLGTWIVNVPGAHPFWSWWRVSVVHLRDVPGAPAARRSRPSASHEFVIAAIDPAIGVPDPDEAEPHWPLLSPLDVVEQLDDLTDDETDDLVTIAVGWICVGSMSPDQDYRTAWHQLLQDQARAVRARRSPTN